MDHTKFTESFTSDYNALFSFAKRLTKDNVKAKDLVQEGALKAFKARAKFRKGSNFRSWMYTIIKNTFITHYRKKKRRNVINAPVDEFDCFLSDNSTLNNAITSIRHNELRGYIDALSATCRKPFRLFVDGYSYKEISSELEIPMGTVKSRINYARTKLKNQIKAEMSIAA